MKSRFLVAFAMFALSLTGCDSADKPTTISSDRPVVVEANQSLAARIDAGHYDFVDSDIQSNFKVESVTADYEAQLVTVAFNRGISSENAVAEIKAYGLRPANTSECIAYGATIAKARYQFDLGPPPYWLACFGSIATFNGERHVLVLGGWNGVWGLHLGRWELGWGPNERLLAVRP
ncbi:MAG: hypothetical protein AAB388_00750 [Patescibacteria group bacterium]